MGSVAVACGHKNYGAVSESALPTQRVHVAGLVQLATCALRSHVVRRAAVHVGAVRLAAVQLDAQTEVRNCAGARRGEVREGHSERAWGSAHAPDTAYGGPNLHGSGTEGWHGNTRNNCARRSAAGHGERETRQFKQPDHARGWGVDTKSGVQAWRLSACTVRTQSGQPMRSAAA